MGEAKHGKYVACNRFLVGSTNWCRENRQRSPLQSHLLLRRTNTYSHIPVGDKKTSLFINEVFEPSMYRRLCKAKSNLLERLFILATAMRKHVDGDPNQDRQSLWRQVGARNHVLASVQNIIKLELSGPWDVVRDDNGVVVIMRRFTRGMKACTNHCLFMIICISTCKFISTRLMLNG